MNKKNTKLSYLYSTLNYKPLLKYVFVDICLILISMIIILCVSSILLFVAYKFNDLLPDAISLAKTAQFDPGGLDKTTVFNVKDELDSIVLLASVIALSAVFLILLVFMIFNFFIWSKMLNKKIIKPLKIQFVIWSLLWTLIFVSAFFAVKLQVIAIIFCLLLYIFIYSSYILVFSSIITKHLRSSIKHFIRILFKPKIILQFILISLLFVFLNIIGILLILLPPRLLWSIIYIFIFLFSLSWCRILFKDVLKKYEKINK